MDKTAIPWATRTWPVTRGCTAVSEGCAHCWARRYHHRFEGLRGWRPFDEIVTLPDKVGEPMRWREPAMVFVCARSDLFHEAVPQGFIETVLATAADCPQHRFLFLTKRPRRMLDFEFPPNAAAGVSIENQARADERLPVLRDVAAPIHFASAEPLLGPIDDWCYLPEWVIVGAESGPGARPMAEQWVRRIRDTCVAAGAALFYKQNVVDGHKIKMPELDGRVWAESP